MVKVEVRHEQVIVTVNNRELTFDIVTDDEVRFVFGRTKFRRSEEVTSEYETVSDLPTGVESALASRGYSVSMK